MEFKSVEERAGLIVEYLPTWGLTGRDVSLKSDNNCRVVIFDAARNQFLRCESLLEANCVLYMMADKNVIGIQTQYAIEFMRDTGPATHFLDLRVTYRNGRVKLFAVRPECLDKSGKLRADVELMRDQVLHQHGHDLEILDETIVTEALVYQACAMLHARDLKNTRDCQRLHQVLLEGPEEIRVFELLEAFGNCGSGWIAMWNLIDQGTIEHACSDPSYDRLTHISWLRRVR